MLVESKSILIEKRVIFIKCLKESNLKITNICEKVIKIYEYIWWKSFICTTNVNEID